MFGQTASAGACVGQTTFDSSPNGSERVPASTAVWLVAEAIHPAFLLLVMASLNTCTRMFTHTTAILLLELQGMLQSAALGQFYKDLQNEAYDTAFAMYHRRFSTNTTPKWPLAQPMRFMGHNGGQTSSALARCRPAVQHYLCCSLGCLAITPEWHHYNAQP